MSGSTKFIALVSIVAAIALGPLIWLIATVVAPALLPKPESRPLQLIPVRPRPGPPPTREAAVRPAESPQWYRGTPDPIASRLRYRTDGSPEFPQEKQIVLAVPPPRSHP